MYMLILGTVKKANLTSNMYKTCIEGLRESVTETE